MADAAELKFSVACGDVSMRITLAAKWQARPFELAVVKAFVASYNKKLPEADAVSVSGLQRVAIDGVELEDALEKIQDAQALASTLVAPSVERVELFFGAPPPREIKVVVKADSQNETKITLDRRWMAKSFEEAVVVPYLSLYNKRTFAQLEPAKLHEVHLQGAKLELSAREARQRPAGRLLQFRDGTHVDLYFSKGAVQTGAALAKAHASRFDIRYSRADYQQAVELVWHHHGLNAGDASSLVKQARHSVASVEPRALTCCAALRARRSRVRASWRSSSTSTCTATTCATPARSHSPACARVRSCPRSSSSSSTPTASATPAPPACASGGAAHRSTGCRSTTTASATRAPPRSPTR